MYFSFQCLVYSNNLFRNYNSWTISIALWIPVKIVWLVNLVMSNTARKGTLWLIMESKNMEGLVVTKLPKQWADILLLTLFMKISWSKFQMEWIYKEQLLWYVLELPCTAPWNIGVLLVMKRRLLASLESVRTNGGCGTVFCLGEANNYRIDANTTALLIRVALGDFLPKSHLFKANTFHSVSNRGCQHYFFKKQFWAVFWADSIRGRTLIC